MRATIWTNSLCCATSQSMTARAYMPSSWNAEWVSSMPGRYCVLGFSVDSWGATFCNYWYDIWDHMGGGAVPNRNYIFVFKNNMVLSVFNVSTPLLTQRNATFIVIQVGIRRPTKQDLPKIRTVLQVWNTPQQCILIRPDGGYNPTTMFFMQVKSCGTPWTLQGRCFSPKFCMACMARIHKISTLTNSLIAEVILSQATIPFLAWFH